MRVTLLSTYHLSGGAGVAATRLHHALDQYGQVDSTLLVGIPNRLEKHRPDSGVSYLANNLLAEQTAYLRFVAERLYFLPFERDPSVRFQFSPAVIGADVSFHPAVQQADVLHLHWINFGFLSIRGLHQLVNLGKPIVWTLHDMWAFTGGCHYSRGCDHFQTYCRQCPYLKRPGERDLSYRVFEQKRKLFAKGGIHLVSPSHWLRDETKQSALLGDFPHTVIPNPIDLDTFRPIDRTVANARLELPNNDSLRLLFGSASVTDPRKGFRYFAEALNRLHEQQPTAEIEVLVFGKGRSYLFNEQPYPVRHLGLLSSENDIVAAYNAADAMVVPSLEDNLPNTIVESLACGTPVVGFQTGGIPEMIDHEQNGYLAAARSADELADGLTFIVNHPNQAELRQHARQAAETRYAADVVAGQYVELYSRLVNE